MRVPNYKGGHRLNGSWKYIPFRLRDVVPAWLRPSTWIMNVAILGAFMIAFASEAKPTS